MGPPKTSKTKLSLLNEFFLSPFYNGSWQAQLWTDFSPYLLRIRRRFLNRYCKWYIGLQNLFRMFARRSHGLADKSTGKRAVRRPSNDWRTETPVLQWPTGTESARRVDVAAGRASPALCPARPRQAGARLQVPSTRPHSATPPVSHFRLLLHPKHSRRTPAAPP